ncbi:hypothetical protein LUZ60_012510 [Juncus effusus]|nr:hypothetical protein LUZ60_012510 [Juncus effusus]
MASKFHPFITSFVLAILAVLPIAFSIDPDPSLLKTFDDWVSKFGRSYQNSTEKLRRYGIFQENLQYIENFNKNGSFSYKLGLNQFADRTDEEFTAILTGSPPTSTKPGNSFGSTNGSTRLGAFDWREMGAVTAVKDQGQCGSCWAFAAVATIEGIYAITTGSLTSFSEQVILDCETYDQYGCNGGYVDRVYSFIINNGGITTETNYPYIGYQSICDTEKLADSSAYITNYAYVTQYDETILETAVEQQPISVLIDASGFKYYEEGVFEGPCQSSHLNHFVTLVGYGTDSDGTKYWIAKNSWGTSWGEEGYVRMQKDVDSVYGLCGLATYPLYPII